MLDSQPQSRDCHDLRPPVQLRVFPSILPLPRYPGHLYFPVVVPYQAQTLAGRLHNPFNLDSITTNLPAYLLHH